MLSSSTDPYNRPHCELPKANYQFSPFWPIIRGLPVIIMSEPCRSPNPNRTTSLEFLLLCEHSTFFFFSFTCTFGQLTDIRHYHHIHFMSCLPTTRQLLSPDPKMKIDEVLALQILFTPMVYYIFIFIFFDE